MKTVLISSNYVSLISLQYKKVLEDTISIEIITVVMIMIMLIVIWIMMTAMNAMMMVVIRKDDGNSVNSECNYENIMDMNHDKNTGIEN